MTPLGLIGRGLVYYWRTHAAVVAGVAAAVAVLSGALLVGDSVRGSLADLVRQRLGRTDSAIVSSGFFREALAADLAALPHFKDSFESAVPLISAQAFVTAQDGGARAGGVRVYGVDERFWKFHGLAESTGPHGREAWIGAALAEELGVLEGATILVRAERPSAVPIESLHGRKEDRLHTLRATVRTVASRERLGEFSLDASQGAVRAVFLPLDLVQRELDVEGRANTILVSARAGAAQEDGLHASDALGRLVRGASRLEDLGLRITTFEDRNEVVLDVDGGLLDDAKTAAALKAAAAARVDAKPVFTYLANAMRIGEREIPYSLVTAREGVASVPAGAPAAIALNTWAARELQARAGDVVTMEYFVWEDPGRLVSRTTSFQVSDIVPLDPTDRALAPVYPGITDSPSLDEWSPPFPLDLRRVRPVDEDYWKRYRATPKAFIPLEAGQRLWRSRYGQVSSVRMRPGPGQTLAEARQAFTESLTKALDPLAMGLAARDVRAQGLTASRGATNFGEYFTYFSFFLVIAALIVTGLFFKLNVEQRARELGLLRAAGLGSGLTRRLFLGEGAILALAGAALGAAAGVGYAALLIAGLRTWWVGAMGTTALALHVSWWSLGIGAGAGVTASIVCIGLTLRGLARVSERTLLSGFLETAGARTTRDPAARKGARVRNSALRRSPSRSWAIALAAAGVALIASGAIGLIDSAGAFFGAGALMVAACLCGMAAVLGAPIRHPGEGIGEGSGRGPWLLCRLGFRNAAYRPARSVAAMAAIAAAAFILISVDAFRREKPAAGDTRSGTGGYALAVDLLVPIARDPASAEGRKALGLDGPGLDNSTGPGANARIGAVEPFRSRPGDDASCLNLYAPVNPRILAPQDHFLQAGRFAFRGALAETTAERANPWLLLKREQADGAIPAIADANSMEYVLHRKLGDEIVVTESGRAVKLRLVAALDDSIFQGELIVAEENFLRAFPDQQGYRFLLAESGSAPAIEEALTEFGADAVSTSDRLAEFHRVENTYISTFQTLGGLGLLLGTAGLGAVLLRSVAERRRELALLRAIGYGRSDFLLMMLAENGVLLGGGLLVGALCALVAIAPALAARGGHLPSWTIAALLASTLAAGLLTALAATAAALRAPLLAALRSE